MLDLINRRHTNPGNENTQKPWKWILVDSIVIGLIAMGASMPMTIPTWEQAWIMFKAFFIAFVFQLAVERGLKRKEQSA